MELLYSTTPTDEAKAVKAMGRNFDISFKDAVVVCDKLRGMKLTEAMSLLESVVALEKTIPFKRFNKGIGHRRGLGKDNIGRYPKKAASSILRVLRNLEANADYKGLDSEKLRIAHLQALKGISRKRRKPKGRWATWVRDLVNVQVIAEES
ncbi:MAG: 50S ribosomal protein L22 [Candidatus Altiarchaeota archaeon]|nr:50S ribosomal protein L22 [Candidatus Altiarchaeota archaeon]